MIAGARMFLNERSVSGGARRRGGCKAENPIASQPICSAGAGRTGCDRMRLGTPQDSLRAGDPIDVLLLCLRTRVGVENGDRQRIGKAFETSRLSWPGVLIT